MPAKLKLRASSSRLPGAVRPLVQRALKLLDALPNGEGMTTADLSVELKIQPQSFRCAYSSDPNLQDYRFYWKSNVIWANKATIAALNQGKIEL